MLPSATAICNLLYRYAELIDSGQLEAAAALFRHARLKTGHDTELDHTRLLALWQDCLILYPCGTPRTRHLITNPILDIDEAAGTAIARSCYTVLQTTHGSPPQIIATGRYHDRFARIGGEWHYTWRDYTLLDFTGDLSRHLKVAVRR